MLMLPPASHGATILKLATRIGCPRIYPQRALAAEGGLISYSADIIDRSPSAHRMSTRILRGAKVADLPVQLPTKYQLVVNTKTAKAIGLTIPEAFLLHADELIE